MIVIVIIIMIAMPPVKESGLKDSVSTAQKIPDGKLKPIIENATASTTSNRPIARPNICTLRRTLILRLHPRVYPMSPIQIYALVDW